MSETEPVSTVLGSPCPAAGDLSTLVPSLEETGDRGKTPLHIDGYKLIREIARGGMGVVYEAFDAKLGRRVALKLMLRADAATTEERIRFEREARSTAKLVHRHIVNVFDFGYVAGLPFITMEYVEGPTLQQQIKNAVLLPLDAARIARDVAVAVGYAHDNGIIHRDLKPANILMDGGTTARVTDFGLARSETDQQLTATEAILGTPSYMAPEQAAGRMNEVGRSSDIYAVGALLYACLTGRPPHQAENHQLTLMQVLEAPIVVPSERVKTTPRDLDSICLKCLARQPADRYSTANELVADLDRFLNSEPVLARPRRYAERIESWIRRNSVLLAVTIVSIITLPAILSATSWIDVQGLSRQSYVDDSVINFLSKEIESSESPAPAHFARALRYFEKRFYEKALTDAYLSLELGYSQPASVWILLRDIYVELERWEDVVKCSDELAAIRPLTAEDLIQLAHAKSQLKEYRLAIDYLSQAIALRPDMTEAYSLRQKSYEATGNRQAAVNDEATLKKLQGIYGDSQ